MAVFCSNQLVTQRVDIFWVVNFLTMYKNQKTHSKTFLGSTLFSFGPLFKQAEKLKSRKMKNEG